MEDMSELKSDILGSRSLLCVPRQGQQPSQAGLNNACKYMECVNMHGVILQLGPVRII